MLLELAIGDAYGAGFEYADAELIRQQNSLAGYVKHPRHHIQPGSYTDDTQMSLAIAEAIVSGEPWTPVMLAERFVKTFQRDPREGYASGFYHFLRRVHDGEQFLKEIRPTSSKSGPLSAGSQKSPGQLSGSACAWLLGYSLDGQGEVPGMDECASGNYSPDGM